MCHDIPGGVNSDKTIVSIEKDIDYRYMYWNYIDIFIYFGHPRVTFPSPGWTNTAHRNGVKMLGTLIFEWDEGGIDIEYMLADKVVVPFTGEVMQMEKGFYIKKMAEFAKFCGFDGYLLNFESPVKIENIPRVIEFIVEFRAELKEVIGTYAHL